MASITVTVAGVDRTSSLCQPGAGQALEWGEALRERPTISCSFVRRTGSWKPQRGQHITMVHSTESDLFGGYITEVSRRKVAGNSAVFFDVTAVAYEQILSRRYAAVGTYIDQTAGAIFEDVMNNSLDGEGFTVSIEEAGPVIPRFEIQSPRPKVVEAAEAICERASSGGDVYYYKITTAKVIRFFKQDTTPAPFSITDAHPYVLGTEGEFATVSESNEGKVNRVFEYMGQYLRLLATESFPGDSATRTFELAYPCGAAPVLVVNETEVGDFLGIDGIDTGKQWYWSLGSKTIRQDDLGTLLTPSDTLYVTYTGQDRLEAGPFEDAADASAEGVLQGDGTGIYEAMLTIETPQTLGDAATHAAAYLARYKRATVTFRGATYTAGLRAGQELTVNLTDLDINLSMLVQSVTMRDVGAGHFLWSFTAIYGAARDDWKRALLGLGASGVVGGSGAGGGAESGGGGAITPLAPNVVSAVVTPIYGLLSAASAFGFTGALRLADDYTHLQSIQPIITLLDGSSENLCPRILPGGGGVYTSGGHPYIDFTSEIKYLQDTLTLQSYSIAFVCYDENGVATDSPLTESVSVQIAKINSITSPREVLSGGNPVVSVDPVTRLVSSKIGGIPVFNGNQVPQYVTYWISENNGSTYLWIGWDRVNIVGTELTFWRVKPATSRSEKIAMCQGVHGGDPTVLISSAQLPTGTVVSGSFTVAGLTAPSSTLNTNPTPAPGNSASDWPYDKLTQDGFHYWLIPYLELDSAYAAAIETPGSPFTLITTFQDFDADGQAIGPEHVYGSAVVVDGTIRIGELRGDYGSCGFSYDRFYPYPDNDDHWIDDYPGSDLETICEIRWKVYGGTRLDQSTGAWTNPAAATQDMSVGSGSGYVSIVVAVDGALPPGKILATRLDPTTLGRGLNNRSASDVLEIGTGDLTNLVMNPRFDSDTAHWELTNGAVIDPAGGETSTGALKLSGNNHQAVTAYPYDLIPCVPDDVYYFSIRHSNDASADGHVTAKLRYHADPDSGAETDVALASITPGTPGDWTDTEDTITVPATIGVSGHKPAYIEVSLKGVSITAGAYWIDRVIVRRQVSAGPGTEYDGKGGLKAKVGAGIALSGSELVAKLSALGGLQFNGSDEVEANLGYTMRLDGAGAIQLSNLPTSFGLPSLPTAAYPQGAVLLNTADSKVYRNTTGSAWVKSSDPADLVAGAIATGVTLAANQISAGTMIAGVVYAGDIIASQVTAGTFNGMALQLNLNGITTSIDNQSDSFWGAYVGLQCVDNGGSAWKASVAPGIFRAQSPTSSFSGPSELQLYANGWSGLELTNRAGGGLRYIKLLVTDTLTAVTITNLSSFSPGAGTKQLWYDASDGNRVKFSA